MAMRGIPPGNRVNSIYTGKATIVAVTATGHNRPLENR